MTGNKERSIDALFKRYMAIIIILVLLVVISIFTLIFISLNSDYKDSKLINVLGRQRMLTQMIAKNANRIYELCDILEHNPIDREHDSTTSKKLASTREDLLITRQEYDKYYETIKKGFIVTDSQKITFNNVLQSLQPVLGENESIWLKYRASIDIILKENSNTTNSMNALKYINENNELLLKSNDDIAAIVSNSAEKKSRIMIFSSIAIAIIALILLIILFINIYRYLFIPVNQLYKGMAEVGITKFDFEAPEIKRQELIPVFSEVKTVFDKFNSLILLIENLNNNIPFKEILNYIYDSFSAYIPYTHIGLALIEDDGMTIKASYGVSGKHHKNLPEKLVGYKINIQETSLGKILETGRERVINDLEEYVKRKPVKEYNSVLLEEGISSSITFPLKNNDRPVGIIFFSSSSKNVYKQEHIEFLRTLANSIVLSLEKNIFIDDMIVSTIQALAALTEKRDTETGEHLQRMKTYSRIIAEFLCEDKKYKNIIDTEFITDIERFSPLHDIGKVGIRDDILLKPSKLNREEFEIMKTHTIYGAWVLKVAEDNIQKRGRSIFKMGIEIAEGHHEKWNGTGYPYGKSGEEIPLSARIVAAADVFDALTSKRPYKEAFSFAESCEIIKDGSGSHFDPDIANIFVKRKDDIKQIYDSFKGKCIL